MVVLLRWKNLDWGPIGIESSCLDISSRHTFEISKGDAMGSWTMSLVEVFSVLAHTVSI